MVLSTDNRNWLDPAATSSIFVPGVEPARAVDQRVVWTDCPHAGPEHLAAVTRRDDGDHAARAVAGGVSVSVGYFHRHYYNLIYSDNTVLDQTDAFTPVTIPNPARQAQFNAEAPSRRRSRSTRSTRRSSARAPVVVGRLARTAPRLQRHRGLVHQPPPRQRADVRRLPDNPARSRTRAIRRTAPRRSRSRRRALNYTLYCDQSQFSIRSDAVQVRRDVSTALRTECGRHVPELSGAELRLRGGAPGLPAADLHRPGSPADTGSGDGTINLNYPGSLYLPRWINSICGSRGSSRCRAGEEPGRSRGTSSTRYPILAVTTNATGRRSAGDADTAAHTDAFNALHF